MFFFCFKMKYLTIPEDTYTISAGSYKIYLKNVFNKVISYDSEINTSENFLKKLVNSITSNLNFEYTNIYVNQNYYTFDFYEYENNGQIFSLMSNTTNISINNNWMYPLENAYKHINTYNFPITRTISIIINSNTLPVYTIPEITVDIEYSGSKKQLIIPEGSYNYSSFNQIFFNFFKRYSDKFTNYFNIPYFEYTRYIVGYNSIIIRDNIELNKYYGLLHMLITYPNNVNFDTSTSVKKFSCNMAPVYRSLHIPEGNYTINGLVDYINTHSSYSYNINGNSSLSYTQFLAKVVDNDVVIYTNDNTEFFINPICSINKYKEDNWSKEHKLCSFEEKIIYDIKPLYYKGQSIYLVPKFNLTNVSAINLPDGLTINSDTGVISGTFSKYGVYDCKISCSEFIGTFTLRFKCNYKCKLILNKFNFE